MFCSRMTMLVLCSTTCWLIGFQQPLPQLHNGSRSPSEVLTWTVMKNGEYLLALKNIRWFGGWRTSIAIRLEEGLRVISWIARLHIGEMTRKREDESGAVLELSSWARAERSFAGDFLACPSMRSARLAPKCEQIHIQREIYSTFSCCLWPLFLSSETVPEELPEKLSFACR